MRLFRNLRIAIAIFAEKGTSEYSPAREAEAITKAAIRQQKAEKRSKNPRK